MKQDKQKSKISSCWQYLYQTTPTAIKIKNCMGRAEVYLRRQTVTKNIDNIRKILLVFQDASFLEKVLLIEDLKKNLGST